MTTIKSCSLIAILLLCACLVSFNYYHTESSSKPIAGKWALIQFYPAKKDTFKYKDLVVFQIESAGMTAGFMGCNKFRTECETNRDSIHFGAILSSRKFCARAYMDLEDQFRTTVSNANIYSLKEEILTLYNGKQKLASFKKQ